MKTTSIMAAGALAGLASAIPHSHHRRDVTDTVTDVVYVTDIITVTEGGPAPSAAPASASTNPAGASAIHSQHTYLHSHHYGGQSSSSSAAAPATYTQQSYGGASSAAPASDSATASVATPSGLPASASQPLSAYTPSSAPSSSTQASSSALPTLSAGGYTTASSSSAPPTLSGGGYTTATSSAPKATGSTGLTGYTGIKAGLSGYVGCQYKSGFSDFAPHIGWYSDYTANTTDAQGVVGIPMLWGDGQNCAQVSSGRLEGFEAAVAASTPKIMFGFYEPDCNCDMSSQMSDESEAVQMWNQYLKPLADKGVTMGSPSMCTQKDETWLQKFSNVKNSASSSDWTVDWDVTSIHINQNSLDGVKADVEYYLSTYGKPIWVSEFACVDSGESWFNPCTDQGEINQFISDAVSFFEGNSSVVAYGPSNGEGLGTTWPLFNDDGSLSTTGQHYLSVIS